MSRSVGQTQAAILMARADLRIRRLSTDRVLKCFRNNIILLVDSYDLFSCPRREKLQLQDPELRLAC